MVYFIYSVFFTVFIIISFKLYKFLLKTTDIMKYMFYIILYVVGILLFFQAAEMIIKYLYNPIPAEYLNFMFLTYLFATMIGFISITIITIKKLKKK
jgi:hypothetical protein